MSPGDIVADVTMRPGHPDDVEPIISLLRILYRGDVGEGLNDLVQEYLNSPSHLVLLAIRERAVGLLIGAYRLDIDYECRAGLVDAIVVEESSRKQGIGTALVREFARWARDRGCTMLQVINPNEAFFDKLGFADRRLRFQQRSPDKIGT